MIRQIIQAITHKAETSTQYKTIQRTNGNIVIHRGTLIKPNYLFIGEAPGHEENQTGKPFMGKSGQILNEWIKQENITSYCIINTVPIIPLTEENKIRPPTNQEIEYYKPLIIQLINAIKPQRIILIGRTAEQIYQYKKMRNTTWIWNTGFIYHPSYYLRNGRTGKKDFKQLIKNYTKRSNK